MDTDKLSDWVNEEIMNRNDNVTRKINDDRYIQKSDNDLITLTRTNIIGKVNLSTPKCVIEEIRKAHNIDYEFNGDEVNYNTLIKSINNTNYMITLPLDIGSYRIIAVYVNKNVERWSKSELTKSFNFLQRFNSDEDPLTLIPEIYDLGEQTPEKIQSLNLTVLYKVCLYHKINTNFDTTEEQLYKIVGLLRTDISTLFKESQIVISSASNKELINLIFSTKTITDVERKEVNLKEEPSKEESSEEIANGVAPILNDKPIMMLSYDDINVVKDNFGNNKYLMKRINPENEAEAVFLSAFLYGMDISLANDKIEEYNIIKKSVNGIYHPKDKLLSKIIKTDKKFLYLHETFNPLFPSELYSVNTLQKMTRFEGYDKVTRSENDPYELMQMAFLTKNFYEGIHYKLLDDNCIIGLENVNEFHPDTVLCYGSNGDGYYAIKLSELTDCFTAHENYISPFGSNELFTDNSIRKLRLICSRESTNHEVMKERRNLLTTMKKIDNIMNNLEGRIGQFIKLYNSQNTDNKKKIQKVFQILLELSYAMRGKIDKKDDSNVLTGVHSHSEDNVFLSVTKLMRKWESKIGKMGELGKYIQNLPLLIHIDGKIKGNSDESEGLTIGGRINIVIENKTVKACIRYSSNWFISTSYYYMVKIGMPPPFDINKLNTKCT